MEKYTSVMQVPRRKFQNGSLKMGHQLATDRKESISLGKNYKPSQRHLEICYLIEAKATFPSFIGKIDIIATREIQNNQQY